MKRCVVSDHTTILTSFPIGIKAQFAHVLIEQCHLFAGMPIADGMIFQQHHGYFAILYHLVQLFKFLFAKERMSIYQHKTLSF